MSERQTPEKDAPQIIPIPDVKCQNCGADMAWRVGVGRYVISHATGHDRCSFATASLADEDSEAAHLAYRKADEAFRANRPIPPGSDPENGPR